MKYVVEAYIEVKELSEEELKRAASLGRLEKVLPDGAKVVAVQTYELEVKEELPEETIINILDAMRGRLRMQLNKQIHSVILKETIA